jgi:hypothetical protein
MVQEELWTAHANDNDLQGERPLVRVPVGRPEQAYAHQGNLILPLRFARLMPGWRVAQTATPVPAPARMAPRRTAARRRPPSARLWRLGDRRAPASR